MYSHLTIGVLALQGDFEKHLEQLKSLKVTTREIRQKKDIVGLDGIIIPGGESTTMSDLLDRFDIREKLSEYCRSNPVWGTCAGMIMLADKVDDERIKPLSVIDISVTRNGYGRQVHSFYANIEANLNGNNITLNSAFIRAPIVLEYGSNVKVYSVYKDKPILLSENKCLVSSFHTELDYDLSLIKFFLDKFVLNV